MATRDHRQTFMASSKDPSKVTPPVSPRGARMRRATSSRRSAPSVPLAQLTKKLMGSDPGSRFDAGGGPGAPGEEGLELAGALLLPVGDLLVHGGQLPGGGLAVDLAGVAGLVD